MDGLHQEREFGRRQEPHLRSFFWQGFQRKIWPIYAVTLLGFRRELRNAGVSSVRRHGNASSVAGSKPNT